MRSKWRGTAADLQAIPEYRLLPAHSPVDVGGCWVLFVDLW